MVSFDNLIGSFWLLHLFVQENSVTFEFQHNVCGRSIYAEGTVDAVLFLAKKVILVFSLTDVFAIYY